MKGAGALSCPWGVAGPGGWGGATAAVTAPCGRVLVVIVRISGRGIHAAGPVRGGPGTTVLYEIASAAVDFVRKGGWAADLYEIVEPDSNFERIGGSTVTA